MKNGRNLGTKKGKWIEWKSEEKGAAQCHDWVPDKDKTCSKKKLHLYLLSGQLYTLLVLRKLTDCTWKQISLPARNPASTVTLIIFQSNDIDQNQKLWNAPREMVPPKEGRGQRDTDAYGCEVMPIGCLNEIAWLVLLPASHNLKGQKWLVCSAAPFISITLLFGFCESLIALVTECQPVSETCLSYIDNYRSRQHQYEASAAGLLNFNQVGLCPGWAFILSFDREGRNPNALFFF